MPGQKGKYTEESKKDPSKKTVIQLSSFTSFADFDGDKINDAAAILTAENNEGKTIYSLALNLNRYFYFKNISDKILGDSDSMQIQKINIEENKIFVQTVQNNIEKQLIFKLSDDQLIEDTGV